MAIKSYETFITSNNNKEPIPLLLSSSVMYDNNETMLGTVINAKDISKLKQVEKELIVKTMQIEEASKNKSDFIATISHEMRTPLTSIKGAIDYILKKTQNINNQANDAHEFGDIIKNNIDRLIKIVNDTLDIERITLGKLEMDFKTIDLNLLIDDIIIGLKSIIRDKQLKVHVHSAKDMTVFADEDRIKQVIVNLAQNAVNFSPAGDVIDIKLYKENNYAVTEVADKGAGVADDDINRLFTRYFKKGAHKGSGLGLAICKSIIEVHNGKIGYSPNTPKGSAFYFKLPLK
ncbi:integral membrane sensor signal transduction histidine kinase [Candidatus Magnetoovum chiemensis]|nr:integral membrane sensor signal transduction histidine kinase [Candidatus Magnetoovum chiemensis]